MDINEMINEFEEATQIAERNTHTCNSEYTKLCRQVANFLKWFKDQDLIRRKDVKEEIELYKSCFSEYLGLNQVRGLNSIYEYIPKAEPFKEV